MFYIPHNLRYKPVMQKVQKETEVLCYVRVKAMCFIEKQAGYRNRNELYFISEKPHLNNMGL